jgi:proline iminopeptidase
MYARVRDTTIFFDVEGVGLRAEADRMVEKPVAILVHGGPGAEHTNFKPVMSPLSDRMQLVYYDHRGHGRSARGPKATYTLENNVEDLEGLRQYLGLDKIVLYGQSYGGMVALSYAVRYPDNLSHLIVVVTSPSYEFLARAQEILAERGTPEQQEAAQRMFAGAFEDNEELRQYFQLMWPLYSGKYDPAKANARWGKAIMSYEAINEGFGGFLRTYDVRDQLHKITCPTLIICGRHDWICPPDQSEAIKAGIPRADLRIFEESGHTVAADETEAFLDVIRGFLVYNQNLPQ